jgi:hypothetical protein
MRVERRETQRTGAGRQYTVKGGKGLPAGVHRREVGSAEDTLPMTQRTMRRRGRVMYRFELSLRMPWSACP